MRPDEQLPQREAQGPQIPLPARIPDAAVSDEDVWLARHCVDVLRAEGVNLTRSERHIIADVLEKLATDHPSTK